MILHLFLSAWSYYHLRSTVKRDRFFACLLYKRVNVYFSNVTVSQTTVSTEPMKMFRVEHDSACLSTGNRSWSSVCILFRNVSDLHNYKVLYGGKILFVKTAKLRLIFNKNYLPEVRCCSFIVLRVLLADLGPFSWVLVPPVSSLHILYLKSLAIGDW